MNYILHIKHVVQPAFRFHMTQVRKQNAILNAILLNVMKIYLQSSKKEAKVATRQLQQYLWHKNFLLYNPWGNIPPLSKTLGGLEDEKKINLWTFVSLYWRPLKRNLTVTVRDLLFSWDGLTILAHTYNQGHRFFQSVEVKIKKNSLKHHLTGCVRVRKRFEIHGPPGCHKVSTYTKDFNY